ncbi:MAG: GTP cyclohydrolase II [Pseudomonadota bacterium]
MAQDDIHRLKQARHHGRVVSDLRQATPVILEADHHQHGKDGNEDDGGGNTAPQAWLILSLDAASEAEWQDTQAMLPDGCEPALLLSAERAALLATGGYGVDHGGMAAMPTVPEPPDDDSAPAAMTDAPGSDVVGSSAAGSDVTGPLTTGTDTPSNHPQSMGIMLPMATLANPCEAQALSALVTTLRQVAGLGVDATHRAQGTGLFGLRSPLVLDRAIRLLKNSFLIPAALVWPLDDDGLRHAQAAGLLRITSNAIDEHRQAPLLLSPTVTADVPFETAVRAKFHVFRAPADGREHVAIEVTGDQEAPADSVPLVRLHAACLTGDLFGSLRCDCGDQLRGALDLMAKQEGGVLLYLAQEGRDIGLVNKMRAYRLQDAGLDTIDANLALGFAADERDYTIAATMLRELGHPVIRLLTNNPDKIAQLEAAGIVVSQRVAHHFPPNPHNQAYIATKQKRAGHLVE